eukprot:gene9420-8678_t
MCGDANGCPGDHVVPNVTGTFGQGPLTAGGEELLDFAGEHRLRVMGTWFRKPVGRGTTWRLPGSGARYTLDHVLVRSRDACHVTDVSPVPVAECRSDHRLLRFTINPARGRGGHARRGLRTAEAAARRGGTVRKHNITALAVEGKDGAIAKAVGGAVSAGPIGDLDAAEAELVAALRSAADSVLGPANSSRRRMGWQADHAEELRAMAAARRELADRPGLSDAARREARRTMRADQQRELRRLVAVWWERRLGDLHRGRCVPGIRAVERLERDAGLAADRRGGEELLGRDGEVLRGHDARVERWRQHFGALFANESNADMSYISDAVPQRAVAQSLDAPPSAAEFSTAVTALKSGKASGADGIVAELIKAGGEAFRERLFDLILAARRSPENFGIAQGDRWRGAAQDADWRRSRLRRRPQPSSSEADASGDSNGDMNGAGDWPRAARCTNHHRTRHVLRCDACVYHTHIAPWLATH